MKLSHGLSLVAVLMAVTAGVWSVHGAAAANPSVPMVDFAPLMCPYALLIIAAVVAQRSVLAASITFLGTLVIASFGLWSLRLIFTPPRDAQEILGVWATVIFQLVGCGMLFAALLLQRFGKWLFKVPNA